MYSRVLAALLLCLLAACAQDTQLASSCGLRLAAEVPVAVRNNQPFVDVAIGDRRATFLLDTGAVTTTMTHRGAARMALEPVAGGAFDVAGIGGTSVGGAARLAGASLAGIPLPAQSISLLPDTSIAGTGGADGILGIKDLAEYEWDIDMPKGRIGLYAGRPCAGEQRPGTQGMVDVRESWTSRPGFDARDPRSHLRLLLDGKPITALVDTGAQGSFIFLHAARRLGITDEELARAPAISTRGFGPQPVRTPLYRFNAVEIGGRRFAGMRMTVVPIDDPQFTEFYEVGVGLGMDYLGRHRVWLAKASRLVLVPGP